MKKELREKFPNWYQNMGNKVLILTNDLDSYFSCLVLRYLFGCEIAYFYDFSTLYYNRKHERNNIVGVDLAIEECFQTFCNHIVKIHQDDKVNPLSININIAENIHRGKFIRYNGKFNEFDGNYLSKYAGSTLLMILSLYDAFKELHLAGHTELTETQKKILMSPDSYFLGYYLPSHWESHIAFRKFQQLLGLEMFNDVLRTHTKQQLTSFQYINKLKKSIYVVDNDGQYKLNTELNLEFLKKHFPMLEWEYINNITFSKKYEFQQMPKQNILHLESKHDLQDRVFSFAVTGQQEAQMTIYR